MRNVTLAVAAVVPLSAGAHAEPIKFARYPHVANGKLAFAYHGDIWVAHDDGSSPMRLTAHVARDSFPRFSPDGRLAKAAADKKEGAAAPAPAVRVDLTGIDRRAAQLTKGEQPVLAARGASRQGCERTEHEPQSTPRLQRKP